MASRSRWLEHEGERVASQERWHSEWARRKLRRNSGKGASVSRKKDEDAAAAEFFVAREEESQPSSVEDKRKWCVAFVVQERKKR